MAHSITPSFARTSPPRRMALVSHVSKRDRRRNEYLATVAHEMRNALGPLSCVIDVLSLRSRGMEAQSDMLPVARRQLAQLVKLTDDLLDLGRAMNDEFQMEFRVEPLEPIVHSVVAAWRVLAEAKHQTISLDGAALESLVRVDRMRLGQAIQNVIGNAVKFTPEGGHISVAVEVAGSQALIQVTDSGIGISVEDIDNLFGLFFRAHEEGSHQRGFGIGLALARRIVEIHGGTISAHSAGRCQGSSFRIALPLERRAA